MDVQTKIKKNALEVLQNEAARIDRPVLYKENGVGFHSQREGFFKNYVLCSIVSIILSQIIYRHYLAMC